MSNIVILDECLQNLLYAEEAMKEWIPLSDYEILFEAGINQDVKDKITKNEETANKSTGFVQKAIDAVIKLISGAIRAIQEFIARLTMSNDERSAFDQFKAAMEQDPKLKNRKLSVLDFRKISAAYDELAREIDQNIKSVDANPEYSIEGITKKVNDFLSGTAGAVTSIVTADVALKMADSNVEMAKHIKKVLETENGVMKSLSKNLGVKEASKFKKEIDAAAKNTKLHQLKVKLFRHKYDSLEECVQGTVNIFSKWGWLKDLNSAGTIAKRTLKNDYTGTIVKTAVDTYVTGKRELKKQELDEKKAVKQSQKDMRKAEKEAKYQKPQRTDGVYAPMSDFVTGQNKKSK